MYNPLTGRFIQRDPIGVAGGENEFAYCKNDPINYTDPSGLDRISIQWNDKESRFDVYTIKDHYEGVLNDEWQIAPSMYKSDAPVFQGFIDNATGLLNMNGSYVRMADFQVEAKRSGRWFAYEIDGSETYDHFNPTWMSTHAYNPKDVVGLRGALIDLNMTFFNVQMDNARNDIQRNAAREQLQKQIDDVFEGTDMAADLVNQLALFYLTVPLDLAASVGSALRYADEIKFGALTEKMMQRKEIGNLMSRASEVHMLLDPVAQSQRTTAILATRDGARIVGSGAVDLTLSQKRFLELGDEIYATLKGAHAEVTVLEKAKEMGMMPRMLVATRDFCPECVAIVKKTGGMIIGNRIAIWR